MSSAEARQHRTSLADRYRVLLDIGRTLTGTLGTEQLFRRIYRESSRVLETAGFYISLYDESRDLATVVFFADRGEERHADITYRGSESEVIRTGEPSRADDRDRIDSLLVLGDEESDVTRSAISAPMRYKDRVIGVVSAQSYRRDCYSTEDLELLQSIADMAAVALENARYVARLERRRREAERIEEIGRAVAGSLQPGEVLRKVTDAALELLEAAGATVWFFEGEREARVEVSGGSDPLEEGLSGTLDPATRDTLIQERAPVLIDDVEKSTAIRRSMREQLPGGSEIAVPLVVEDEVVGALSVGSREPRAFSDDEVRIASQLASQASVALENARLHSSVQALSLTDPLTGLANRRHMEMHLEREFAAAHRGRDLAAVIFDLDDFKRFNDNLGHHVGDRILIAFGRILDDETRSMNLAVRYGGDEFVSILSDTSGEGAQLHARRVIERIGEDPELAPHRITVSYGAAGFRPEMEEPSELIRAADDHLYRTKDGRSGAWAARPGEATQDEEEAAR